MKDEYDFSNAQRGKFYNPNAVFKLPVYLDEQVHGYLAAKAEAKGIDLSALVNDLLKREIELVEAMEVVGV
jgi:predicted HicB family RNase H-like nuclease